MTLQEIGDIVSQVGTIGLLAFAFYALHKGWWVPGKTHSEVVAERNTLREEQKASNLEMRETLNQVREQDRIDQEAYYKLLIEYEALRRKGEKANDSG